MKRQLDGSTDMQLHRRLLFSLVLLSIALGGCGQPKPLSDPNRELTYDSFKGKTVAFLPILFANDLAQGWYKGMRAELEPLGVSVVVRDANLSTSAGAQALTRLIIEKPAIIVVQNPDLTAYARLIQRAELEGIHVIQVNMRSSAPSTGYVGPDWDKIGEMQGQAAVQACRGGSNEVAIVQGSLTSAANAYSMNGIARVFAAHPEMRIVSNQAAEWDTAKAKSITQAVLRQHPALCAVLGSYDGMDLGIAAAIKEAGLSGQVALFTSGGGTQQTACDQVKSGSFTQEIAYSVPTQVTQITTIIKLLLSSNVKAGTFKSTTYTNLVSITKANADKAGLCWSDIG